MTSDFADQEAERIITGLAWTYKPFLKKEIAEALRKAYQKGLDQKWNLMQISPTTKLVHDISFEQGFEAAKSAAAKVVNGEIQIYEEQAPKASPSRHKKIQRKWFKLKRVLNDIRNLKPRESVGG